MDANELASFGKWLKQRREALDLTQRELADASGCSLSTIRKMELGLRRPSKQVAELLASCLEIAPEEYATFMQFARGSVTAGGKACIASPLPLISTVPSHSGSAPAVTQRAPEAAWPSSTILPTPLSNFIGREQLLEHIRSLLWRVDVRLVTLTGPPGIGKSRLAIEVASGLLSDFADGARFAALAAISDPDLVLPAIARLLDVSDSEGRTVEAALAEHLRDKNMLLLLDNFEQVVDAAPAVARVLQAAPRVKALITSRVPLHLYGEHEVLIPPMELPASDEALPVEELRRYEGIQLFARRAQSANSAFALTADNGAMVAEICHRLDGLPLAIELAAARCKLYSVEEVLSRLEDRFALLAGGPRDLPERQRTLRAAIDWSYDLLDEGERELFCRIGVFAGSCGAEAASAVAGNADDARKTDIGLLESLVDKNLLIRRGGRYAMLETMRQYALGRLRERGEETVTRERHAQFYAQLAQEADSNMMGPGQAGWLDRLELELDNVRSALGWLIENGRGQTELTRYALQLASSMFRFWYARGYFIEGREWLHRALANAWAVKWDAGSNADKMLRARTMDAGGRMAWAQGDYQEAASLFETGLLLSREAHDKEGVAHRLNGLAQLALDRLDFDEALKLYEEALGLARELDNKPAMARTLNNMAGAYRNMLDYEKARAHYEESAALFWEMGNKANVVSPLTNLALVAMDMEDYAAARRYQDEALALSRELGHKENLAFLLAFVGQRAVEEEDFATAISAYSEALPIVRDMGYKIVLAMCLEGLAAMQARTGEPLDAIRLWGGAEGIREAIDMPLPLPSKERYEKRLAEAHEAVGEEAFRVAWAEGQGMSADEVVEFVSQLAVAGSW